MTEIGNARTRRAAIEALRQRNRRLKSRLARERGAQAAETSAEIQANLARIQQILALDEQTRVRSAAGPHWTEIVGWIEERQ